MLQKYLPLPRIGMMLMAWLCISSAQQTFSQELTAVQNYAMNRPGVVMIKTVFSANVYVRKIVVDNRRFNRLLESIQKQDTSGVIFTPEQKLDMVLQEMNDHPNHFFKTTLDYIQQPEEITSTGTGFFITGDGYVATNCHLIDRENAFIRRRFILSAFQQITEANIAALESAWATSFTEQQRNLLYSTYASLYSRVSSMVLYDLKKDVFVVYSTDRNNKTVTEKKPAGIIIKGQSMPGKDIAVLKIDGDTALPTLKIAPSQLPKVGEQLYVYGYPGPVTNNDYVAVESAIEPTLTTGIVSAIKKSINGWPLIQMDANINHGSSGGPVCNDKGEVIGLTTFGSIANSGDLAAGLNFAIPISILYEYLDTASITPRVSRPSQLFSEGVAYFEKGHYRKALTKFEAVKKLNANYPGLDGYISNCKTNLDKGENGEAGFVRRDLLGIAILSLIGLVIYLLFKKRKVARNVQVR